MKRAIGFLAFAICSAAAAIAAGPSSLRETLLATPVDARLGGDITIDNDGDRAFTHEAPNASPAEERLFAFGNRVFGTEWVDFSATLPAFDGLGPTFNRTSCGGCHAHDGRGQPPAHPGDPMDSMLVRLSAADSAPHPAYGNQLEDDAIPGVPPEGRASITYAEVHGTYGDGTPYALLKPTVNFSDLAFGPLDGALVSARVAPAMVGLGLLEAVPTATLEALADPGDADGDGISGRINWLDDGHGNRVAGRFGWKANVASLPLQAAGAALGDMGVTTSLDPVENCPVVQTACAATAHDAAPDMSDSFFDRLIVYIRTLAVPAARGLGTPAVAKGEAAFRTMGCASCHMPTLQTGPDPALPGLASQTFHPFTDLLIHDMGEGLADNRPDGSASGTEWRTAPLWGLGLIQRINGHDRLLHDGRARGTAEAILWHGGEAAAAREAFRTAPADERAALLAFLGAL